LIPGARCLTARPQGSGPVRPVAIFSGFPSASGQDLAVALSGKRTSTGNPDPGHDPLRSWLQRITRLVMQQVLGSERPGDRVVGELSFGFITLERAFVGLTQITFAAPGRSLGRAPRSRAAGRLIQGEGLFRGGLRLQTAREYHCVFDRVGAALPQKRQHRMRRIAQQYDAPGIPLFKPGTAEQSPLEQLAAQRPRNDRTGAVVEAREFIQKFVKFLLTLRRLGISRSTS